MYKKILPLLIFFVAIFFETTAQAPNDDCSGSTVIFPVPFGVASSTSVSANTVAATPSVPGTTCVASPDDDLWYRFEATSSSIIFRYANARNLATGNQTSPSFVIYEGLCPLVPANTFFCQALTVSGNGFRIVNGLNPGNVYWLRLWSLSAGIAMALDFCIQEVPGPSCSSTSHNDDIWYSFVANSTALRVYPNPVSRYLVIQMPVSMPVASISLFNSAGIPVKQLRRQSIPNGVYTMDLQNQPAGIYLMQVSNGQQNYRYKVIKQ